MHAPGNAFLTVIFGGSAVSISRIHMVFEDSVQLLLSDRLGGALQHR